MSTTAPMRFICRVLIISALVNISAGVPDSRPVRAKQQPKVDGMKIGAVRQEGDDSDTAVIDLWASDAEIIAQCK